MYKEEFQQTIKNMKCEKDCVYMSSFEVFKKGFEKAKELALLHSNSLDESEKPVITKDEAKWINDLKSIYDLPDVLYHITRCGYDGNGFTFTYWGSTYELPIKEGIDCSEVDIIRERLVNAVIYGYKIKEEKLYQVELPGSHKEGDIILVKNDDGDITYDLVYSDRWKERDYTKLTEDEIKKDHEWAWQFAEEVKE